MKKRYVVVLSPLGRLKEGMHHLPTDITRDAAYVKIGETACVQVPKEILFEKKEDACRYLAEKGEMKWVAERKWGRGAEVYRAKVRATFELYHFSRRWCYIVARGENTIVRTQGEVELFEMKEEARKHALSYVESDLKKHEEGVKEEQARVKELRALKKRLGG